MLQTLQKSLIYFIKINPDIIINTVGITDIDYCEQNKFESWKVNSLPFIICPNWVRENIKKS